MKTLKSMLTGIALLFICAAANATVKPIDGTPSKNDVVNMYIDAIANGKTNNLNNIFENEMQYYLLRGQNVNALNKTQVIDYLKNNFLPGTSVTTKTSTVQDDDETFVIKVEFEYSNFERTDVVTLNKANGWQIVKVASTFQ